MNSKQLWPRPRGGFFASAVALCALAFVAFEPTARAQADAAETAQSTEYRELIEQALSEFKHKNWPEARVLFRRAHELSPNARTLRGMGVVSYEMRDYVTAVTALAEALSDTRQPLTDAQRKECSTLLARSRTFVGAYVLKLEPPSAEIRLDGAELVRDAEGRVLVPFGEHTLHASANGYQESSSRLTVQGGETGELRVVLYRPEQSASAPVSSIEKSVAMPPPSASSAAPSEQKRGFGSQGLQYTWIAAGAGAVFGAVAATSWFVGKGELDDLDAQCQRAASQNNPCQPSSTDTGGVERFEKITNAMIGLTGAAVVATAVLMVLEWPGERKETPRKLSVGLSPQRLSLQGSF